MHNAGCCSSLCVTGEKEQTLCQSNHSTEITVITTPYLKNNSNKQQSNSAINVFNVEFFLYC